MLYHPFPLTRTKTRQAETPGEEDARCICNKGDFGSFMLDCDDCHKWFHGACVGIDAANPPKISTNLFVVFTSSMIF